MESTSPPPENIPNWVDLPPEVTAMILNLLGPIEILNTARKVCVTWRKICYDPSMWKSIDMRSNDDPNDFPVLPDHVIPYDLEIMCRHAVDLSCGLLQKIRLDYFCSGRLLDYIADRSPQLRSLRVAFGYGISDDGLVEVAKKLVNLEELHLFFITMPTEAIECFGRCCPQLKSLTYNIQGSRAPYMEDVGGDKDALAIAQTMSGLRHLSLFGNQMTNKGLQDILNGCPHLESLDLRQCFYVDLSGDLGRTCAERIKKLMRPNDSTDGYEYDATVDDGYGDSSYDDEYPSAFSDIDFMSDVDDDFEFSGGGGSDMWDGTDMSDDYDGL